MGAAKWGGGGEFSDVIVIPPCQDQHLIIAVTYSLQYFISYLHTI